MKKTFTLGAALALFGLGTGVGLAVDGIAPTVQGVYGYFAGFPVYSVALSAKSGLYVPASCPDGGTLSHMPMANGGHALLCK